MEEWIGERWHRFITGAAERGHAEAAVALPEMQQAAGLLYRQARRQRENAVSLMK